jgi:hypothetical protein
LFPAQQDCGLAVQLHMLDLMCNKTHAAAHHVLFQHMMLHYAVTSLTKDATLKQLLTDEVQNGKKETQRKRPASQPSD